VAELVFTNNASSLLAASIDDNDLVVQVDSGDGALFPNPGAGQFFKLALVNAMGDLEICHCTSRAGDLLTVTRAQEGTAAQSWTNGTTRVELRLTANTMERMLQKSGDTMTGNLLMDDNEIQDARITGDTVMEGGQLVGTVIRGTEDDASNEIEVPSDGSRAMAGGSPLIVQADNLMTLLPIGTILMWYGSLGSLPSGWQNCDGTNGSPDLRGSFPRGAGGALALGASGGSATATGNTSSDGAHDHGASTDSAAADLAAHTHSVRGASGPGSVIARPNIGDAGVYGLSGAAYGSGPFNPFYAEDATADGGDLIQSAGAGGGHAHGIQSDGAHTHSLGSVATIPPYKAVYFIMKVA
jgi:hypothetical protein